MATASPLLPAVEGQPLLSGANWQVVMTRPPTPGSFTTLAFRTTAPQVAGQLVQGYADYTCSGTEVEVQRKLVSYFGNYAIPFCRETATIELSVVDHNQLDPSTSSRSTVRCTQVHTDVLCQRMP